MRPSTNANLSLWAPAAAAILPATDVPRWRVGERLEQLFEAQCDALPEATLAVDGPAGRLTYRELDIRANRLARYLKSRADAVPRARVALLLDRAVDAYTAMLGVLKLGGAYVPLDASLPPVRCAYIVGDVQADLVISCRHLAGSLAELPAELPVVFLDEVALGDERPERLPAPTASLPPDQLCYVIYTSGTTGRPKGVAVNHSSICNFVRIASEAYGVRRTDRMYQGLTIAFDFCVEEIWVAWMAGATLIPKPAAAPLLGDELGAFLAEHGVSALCAVPSVLATVEDDLPDLRFLLVSGEACPADLAARWFRPGRRVLNVYGPTEATVSATWAVLSPGRAVTIGRPLPTYSAVVLDPAGPRVLEVGEEGELGLAGIGLADGYVGRPELTERVFVADFVHLPHNPSKRIYRTGDLVRLNADGELEHLGRIDSQVKLRGYRIELGEIEAVLRSAPGVAQAVLTTFEPSPGHIELAAYYTEERGHRPRAEEVVAHLRQRLPAYMVPASIEPIPRIPLTSAGKLERGALPPPRRLRPPDAPNPQAIPAGRLESALAEELAVVLGLEQVSATAHFFDELGANSLLMAHFAARLRRRTPSGRCVAMRDIYLHPTVRRLAAALEEVERDAPPPRQPASGELALPEPVGTPHHKLCALMQGATLLLAVALIAGAVEVLSGWVFATHGFGGMLLRSLAAGGLSLLGLALLPVAAKWLLVGRWRPQRIRIWSLAYLRFWLVRTLSVLNPLPHLLVGTPLFPLYLRAMGARIGPGVLILSQHVPVCADVLSIGGGSVVSRDTYLNGYRARDGVIEIGPVTLGTGAFIGSRAVLDICTGLGDGAQLGHSSSLQAGQRVPAGECWHGSPAEPAGTRHEYRSPPGVLIGPARRIRYAAARLLMILLLLGPVEIAIGGGLVGHPGWIEHLSLIGVIGLAGAALGGGFLLSLVMAAGVPRLLTRFLEPGRVYRLYGIHYGLQRLIARTSNNPLLTGLFGDSVVIVHYLRLLGYRLGAIEQTGSNFGLEVKHDVPALCQIGPGTMASDGLAILNAEFSSTSFRVLPVAIGRHNYIGNLVDFPPGARTGENVLLATKAMIPLEGPVRSDVGLLGSPSFEIPRSVARDHQFDHLLEPAERTRRLGAKTRHNLVTMVLHLLLEYLLVVAWLLVARAPLAGRGLIGWGGATASGLLEIGVMLALFVGAERALTRLHPLRPRSCSILQPDFWRQERYWKVAPTNYQRLLDGTPFKPFLWRALGVPVGRGVFDDGLTITERTLVRIGDGATFNMGAVLQSHTLEDGAFKSDWIEVRERATVGSAALVNYDVTLGEGAIVEADAFVMKGSRVGPGERWRGNPAGEVSSAPAHAGASTDAETAHFAHPGEQPEPPLLAPVPI